MQVRYFMRHLLHKFLILYIISKYPKKYSKRRLIKIYNSEIEEIKTRLVTIEENQHGIIQNQTILSNGQGSMVANQEGIAATLERNEETAISKAEFMAQSHIIMEAKVSIKKVEASVCRMTGETSDPNLEEVSLMLPLKTIEEVGQIEQRLMNPDFSTAMKTYMMKCKGVSQDVGSVIRHLFTDDLLDKYNWEGRWEKQCLIKLVMFDKILRDVFSLQGAAEFEKNIRKAVERSHHRVKQKAYAKKSSK